MDLDLSPNLIALALGSGFVTAVFTRLLTQRHDWRLGEHLRREAAIVAVVAAFTGYQRAAREQFESVGIARTPSKDAAAAMQQRVDDAERELDGAVARWLVMEGPDDALRLAIAAATVGYLQAEQSARDYYGRPSFEILADEGVLPPRFPRKHEREVFRVAHRLARSARARRRSRWKTFRQQAKLVLTLHRLRHGPPPWRGFESIEAYIDAQVLAGRDAANGTANERDESER